MKKRMYFILYLIIIVLAIAPFTVSAAEDRGVAVIVYQPVDGAIGPGDQAIADRFASLGFTVKTITDADSVLADFDGAAVAYISESCSSANVIGKFATATVPVFESEMAAWPDFGLGTQLQAFDAAAESRFSLVGSHEINAELGKTEFDFFTGANTYVGIDASTVSGGTALLSIDGSNIMFTAYEKGAALASGTAPARRIASGIYGQTAQFLTADAWTYFDLLVNWLSPPPVVEVIVEETPETNVTTPDPTPAEVQAPAVTAPVTAPQTSDAAVIFAIAALISAVAIQRLRRTRGTRTRGMRGTRTRSL
jgi:hypothetical protein